MMTIINIFLTKNRKNILYFLGILIIFFALFDTTLAVDNSTENENIILKFANFVGKIAAAFLGMLTFLAGIFLYPEWTSGTMIGLGGPGGPLKTIWILISNVVYFVFAMLFVWIAFMNIIGKEDGYQLKEALPRFIVGVFIVPFSWYFVQFILSISSILTIGVLSLPYDIFKESSFFKDGILQKIEFCKEYVITTGTSSGSVMPVACKGKEKITLEQILSGKDSSGNPNPKSLFGIMAFYTYGVMDLESILKLFQGDLNTISDVFSLGVKGIFDLIFIVIYTLLMIALTLALFTRGVYLWFFAMFSPVFGLLYYFKKIDGGGDGAFKSFSIKEFIALAFVPVYVSAALAFGLVFLFVAGKGFKEYEDKDSGNKIFCQAEGGQKGDCFQLGEIKMVIVGTKSDSTIKEEIKKLIWGFQGAFGTLILETFGLAILWMAVIAALKKSAITANVISPFEQFGNSIGGLIKDIPKHVPIIPGTGLSASGLAQVGSSAKNYYDQKSVKTGTEFMKEHDLFRSESSEKTEKSTMAYNSLKNSNPGDTSKYKETIDAIKNYSSTKNLYDDSKAKELVSLFGERLGLNPNDRKVDTQDDIKNTLVNINAKLRTNPLGPQLSNRDNLNRQTIDIDLFNGGSSSGGNNNLNGNQNINIDTGLPEPTLQNISLNIKYNNGAINDPIEIITDNQSKINSLSGKFNENDFKTKILEKIQGLEEEQKKKIIEKLKLTAGFFINP